MRPLPVLLTTLLTIISLSPETQAQSKPSTGATASTATKSIDQLVAKINADIKAMRTGEQKFFLPEDATTWKEVRSKQDVAQMEAARWKKILTVWRDEGQSIVKVVDEDGHRYWWSHHVHYFRSDGSLAKFDLSDGGNQLPNGENIHFDFRVTAHYDGNARLLSVKKSAFKSDAYKDGKKVPIAFPKEQEAESKPSFMHASQVASFRNRR
jgi:hypothetical protein